MTNTQDEVFAFLSSPAAWPTGTGPVDTIETHGARVFLGGNIALKVKRAITLPYLDFSTLAKRMFYCDREIAINGGGAPGLYRDVAAITREADGSLAIGGAGTPVEYAIRMQRFKQDALLTTVVDRGALTPAIAGDLADAIARYHAHAPAGRPGQGAMEAVVSKLIDNLERFKEAEIAELVRSFSASARRELARTADVRATRAEQGHIRRCHGDLHLGNIVMWQGRPVPFDALEFDEDMASTDTLYDLAFLLMDLDRRGARWAANAVLNRYLWRTRDIGDVHGLALMPLFLASRAAIRAMVGLDRAEATGRNATAHARHAAETLRLALRDLDPPRPVAIAVGGLSGTGKTTLARALAPTIGAAPGALHVRSDMERKALAGVEPEQRLPSSAYTKESSAAVYERIFERAAAALKAGHAVILDAVFADPAEREEATSLARRAGVPFHGLWLEGGGTTLKNRVAARQGDASDATPDVVDKQLAFETGPMTWTRIDASGPAEVTRAAAERILPPLLSAPEKA